MQSLSISRDSNHLYDALVQHGTALDRARTLSFRFDGTDETPLPQAPIVQGTDFMDAECLYSDVFGAGSKEHNGYLQLQHLHKTAEKVQRAQKAYIKANKSYNDFLKTKQYQPRESTSDLIKIRNAYFAVKNELTPSSDSKTALRGLNLCDFHTVEFKDDESDHTLMCIKQKIEGLIKNMKQETESFETTLEALPTLAMYDTNKRLLSHFHYITNLTKPKFDDDEFARNKMIEKDCSEAESLISYFRREINNEPALAMFDDLRVWVLHSYKTKFKKLDMSLNEFARWNAKVHF